MKCKKQYFTIIFFLISIIICGHFNLSFAEEKVQPYYPTLSKSKQDKEKCINSFDIYAIDFLHDEKIVNQKVDIGDLVEYFKCRAVVKDNIDECRRLTSPMLYETCQTFFTEYYEVYGKLAMTGYVSPQILYNFKKFAPTGMGREFLQAWLKDDVSFCEKVSESVRLECKAMISGDERLCPSHKRVCTNKALYFSALKTANIKKCEDIKGNNFEGLKLICQAIISGDKEVCENATGFKKFRNKYCE